MNCGSVKTKIPVIGTIHVGHVKCPMGLEGDMTSSSRCMTFMERSSYSEAIELNQNFVTGIWFGNSYARRSRGRGSAAAFRPDRRKPPEISSERARLACRAASPACPSMKTKVGTCCTWAFLVAGGTERTTSATGGSQRG